MKSSSQKNIGFSLVEVVLALGVIAFALVAILGVMPAGLNTGRSAQGETRAAHIAQDVFSSLTSQAASKFPNLVIYQPATSTTPAFSYNIDVSRASQYDTLAADSEGRLIALNNPTEAPQYPYYILVQVNPTVAGFESQVTVRVVSPPSAAKQTVHDYVRIISKY